MGVCVPFYSTCITLEKGMLSSQAIRPSHCRLQLLDDAAVYSASVVYETTQCWCLLHQSTGVEFAIVTIPDVLRRVSRHMA